MPITDPKDRGTEKDGSSANKYCKYCYQQGKFTNPRMTYDEMKIFLTQKMRELNLPESITKRAVESLPFLTRWRKAIVAGD